MEWNLQTKVNLEQDEEIHDPVTRYPTVNLEVNPDRVFRSKVNHLVKVSIITGLLIIIE